MFLLTITYTLKYYCLCMKRAILFSSKPPANQKATKSSGERYTQQNAKGRVKNSLLDRQRLRPHLPGIFAEQCQQDINAWVPDNPLLECILSEGTENSLSMENRMHPLQTPALPGCHVWWQTCTIAHAALTQLRKPLACQESYCSPAPLHHPGCASAPPGGLSPDLPMSFVGPGGKRSPRIRNGHGVTGEQR